eukprot:1935138-Ditylum_brightwellii.AAC.1
MQLSQEEADFADIEHDITPQGMEVSGSSVITDSTGDWVEFDLKQTMARRQTDPLTIGGIHGITSSTSFAETSIASNGKQDKIDDFSIDSDAMDTFAMESFANMSIKPKNSVVYE